MDFEVIPEQRANPYAHFEFICARRYRGMIMCPAFLGDGVLVDTRVVAESREVLVPRDIDVLTYLQVRVVLERPARAPKVKLVVGGMDVLDLDASLGEMATTRHTFRTTGPLCLPIVGLQYTTVKVVVESFPGEPDAFIEWMTYAGILCNRHQVRSALAHDRIFGTLDDDHVLPIGFGLAHGPVLLEHIPRADEIERRYYA